METEKDTKDSNFCSQNEKDMVKEVGSKTAMTDSNSDVVIKREIEEEALKSQCVSQNETEFFPEDPVMRFNSISEVETKMEIKEEQQWLEQTSTETVYVCDNIKDEAEEKYSSLESTSVCKENVHNYDSALISNEELRKAVAFSMRMDSLKSERARKSQSQESNVRNVHFIETCASSVISDGDINNMASHSQGSVNVLQLNKSRQDEQTYAHHSFSHRSDWSHESIKKYTCDICNKIYINLSGLETHKISHIKKIHKCDRCGKICETPSKLKIHKLKHEGIRPYKCNICGKSFHQVSHLTGHKVIHNSKKRFMCDICDKGYNHLLSLKTHKMIHEGIKPYKCNICEKAFVLLSNLRTHSLIHDGSKPHKCNICDKAFTHSVSLKRHRLSHEGKKPHNCKICNKAFTCLSYLRAHTLTHEDKKLHKCDVCNKTFAVLSYLKRHKLSHQGRKPYKCSVCDKTVYSLWYLRKHELIHEGKKSYKCITCDKAFALPQYLKRHQLIHERQKPDK